MRRSCFVGISLMSIALIVAMSGCGGGSGTPSRGGGGGDTTTTTTFAVVADTSSNNVPILGIASTGTLTPVTGSPITQGANPTFVAVAPNGKWVYIANFGTVGQLGVSTAGAVTFLDSATVPATLGAPGGIVVDPSGKFVLVANQAAHSVSVFAINQTTGSLPAVATTVTPVDLNAAAMTMSGKFLYLSAGNQIEGYTLDSATGALTRIPATPFPVSLGPAELTSLVVSPGGNFLYAADSASTQIHKFSLNSTTGFPEGGGGGGLSSTDPTSIVMNPTGTMLFAANPSNDRVTAYFLNSTTGEFTSTFPLRISLPVPTWVAYDATNNFLLVLHGNNQIAVFKVDSTIGSLTQTGPTLTVGTRPTALAVAKP